MYFSPVKCLSVFPRGAYPREKKALETGWYCLQAPAGRVPLMRLPFSCTVSGEARQAPTKGTSQPAEVRMQLLLGSFHIQAGR